MRRLRGRAWGNALGGWRLQGRNSRGQFVRKAGGAFRTANRAGRMAQYRRTLASGGSRGTAAGFSSAGAYAIGAARSGAQVLNSARAQGFFINPEIGLSGAGVSVGYGRKVAKNYRATVAIKVAVKRTDNGPVRNLADKALDRSGLSGELYNLAKYGVADTPVNGTVVVRQGDMLKVKSGKKASTAQRSVPKKRAAQDKAKREQKQYRAQRRNQQIGNGHALVQKNSWDSYKGSRNRAEIALEHQRIRKNQQRRPIKRRSNKKGVASTISA